MKKRTGDDWFPFWIDKWLLGSTRDELTIEQCAIWVDFLALSYKDEGYIRANEGIPYPIKRLSGLLNRPVKLIQQTIDRCLEPEINKLRLESDGTLYVISHPEYELSKRHKRRLSEDDVRQKGHDVQKTDAKSRVEESRVEESRVEKTSCSEKHSEPLIEFDFKNRKWLSIKIEDKSGWLAAYPACDINLELHKMREWLLANPEKKKKNYRRFIVNWLIRTQDKGGSQKFKRASGGRPMTRKEERKELIRAWVKKPIKEDK